MRTVPRLYGSALMAVVLSGCAGLTPSASSSTAPLPSSSIAPASAYRLYVTDGATAVLRLVDASTGTVERQLPMGTPSPDWTRLYTVSHTASTSVLSSIDTATGAVIRQIVIGGQFQLPPANFRGDPGGLSPNGRWLVLQRQAGGRSDFVIVDTALTAAGRQVGLTGDFAFDGINNDASNLFLIQSLGASQPGHYSVRLFDLRSNALNPNIIVDKREASSAAMSGTRIAGVFSPDGQWQYSLYDNPRTGAFIHALNLTSPFAWCIDLPGPKINHAAQRQWGLAVTADGSALYAANPALGLVAEIRMVQGPLALSRTASFTALPTTSMMPFGAATLSRDEHTLFASAGLGLVAIDTGKLNLRSRLLQRVGVAAFVASPDGAWLYASSPDRGVLRIDPATGQSVQAFTTGSSWTLYRAEPK